MEKHTVQLTGSEGRPFLLDYTFKTSVSNKPIIIFIHGFKGFKDWGCWNVMAAHMAEQGFVVVKFNFSHNGTTIVDPLNFEDLEAFGQNTFAYELSDTQRVLEWICDAEGEVAEADASHIHLIGHSRGGGSALLTAAFDSRVKSVATWASVAAFDYNYTPEMLETWEQEQVMYIANARTGQQMPLNYSIAADFIANRTRYDIQRHIKTVEKVLLVHGSADPTVPVQHAHDLKKAQPKAELLVIEGADHVFGSTHPCQNYLPKHLAQAANATIAFFKT